MKKRSLYNRGSDNIGVEAIDGDRIYGFITCRVGFDKAVRRKQFCDSITEFALEEFAALETGIEERFSYVSFKSEGELESFLTKLFADEPRDLFSEAR